jgi:hypothetical protein
MACPRHRLSPVTVVADTPAANFPAFFNPHSIVRKTIEDIMKAPATCKYTTIPQPVFIGLEERLREKIGEAEMDLCGRSTSFFVSYPNVTPVIRLHKALSLMKMSLRLLNTIPSTSRNGITSIETFISCEMESRRR